VADDGDKRFLQRFFFTIASEVADAGDNVGHLSVSIHHGCISDAEIDRYPATLVGTIIMATRITFNV